MIRLPGYRAREHVWAVPLDHAQPDGPRIEIFARELVDPARQGDDLPCLLFLQGGPGGKGPRPLERSGTGNRTFQQLAEYLSLFRAASIVADAEILRRALIGERRWDALGQSYGGFITMTYLSHAPQGLAHCYLTGGIPGITATAPDVYARTFQRAARRSCEYYARYPRDEAAIGRLLDHLDEREVVLPDGDVLTATGWAA